ncbi:lysophospholipid acyltransferase family protein [Polaribacter porphyrae]|uniref:Lipid A biosynthesis acyltransferase n=1 Tax=Polaribacter porphyrae TaxID=1137780 RepID=A0A2S7WME5_9FLAO|nr:lysophospholipid acyltransferase family protein [Polaribacter porphyrae]PQJ78770.1 lipid A biosynthesis acyltransferase [Polaribacter porphyrae]
MNSIVFYLTYPLIWLISRLPMFLLYLISDFLFFLVYYIFGYRKEVIMGNISVAFPEKTDKERKLIAKKFYKHFTDMIAESLKSFAITEKQILKRYTYKNPELVNKYVKEGKSVALVSAHLANWEWSFSLPLVIDGNVFGAYNKLRNETFEKTLKENREKFGVVGATTANFIKLIKQNFKTKTQGSYILLSDQSPHVEKTFHWAEFFGVKVPVHTGAEMLAKKHDLVVINYRAKKIKRGYYETDFELIAENPNDFKDYDITEKFLKITERNVKEQPEFYLWSHKRFKHKDRFEEWKEIMKKRQEQKK